jgi:hypothetical protein
MGWRCATGALVGIATWVAGARASADGDVRLGGVHVDAAGGLAYAGGLQGRAGLEAGALATTAPPPPPRGTWSQGAWSGWMFGGAGTFGFERLRATVVGEIGYGVSDAYVGGGVFSGPEVQVAREAGLGASARFVLWAWASEVGVRIGGLALGAREVNASLLLGFGVF